MNLMDVVECLPAVDKDKVVYHQKAKGFESGRGRICTLTNALLK